MPAKNSRLYVGGRWLDTPATFPVEDPATGEPIAEAADATPEHALAALDAAHAAQAELAASSPRTRSGWLLAAFDAVVARTEEFAETITRETGKPLAQSRGELAYGAEFLRWFAEQATQLHGDFVVSPDGGSRILTTHRPVGPALLITPWNFPLAMLTRKLGAALAAGCPTLLKPAEQTPLTAVLLTEVLAGLGLPAGAVNLLTTTRAPELSAALMADDRLRKVSFTGSTAVGSALIRQSAQHVQRTSMELGGNAPFLVFDDADLDTALDAAMLAKFRNGGESCVAANRFLVHRSIAREFTERFTQRVRELVPGNGFDPSSTVGPLIDARQRDKVHELVRDAVAGGAEAVTGGGPVAGPGYFFEPTVLTGVGAGQRVLQEEIFGPVAPITVFDTEAEALELANATRYGLVAFVCTRDVSRAVRVAEACETGMVGINRGIVSEPAAPFGGVKASGLGREGGRSGIGEYLETGYFALGR
ncbi:NAD-dependent succinate-semialdehyde dehydrogenase [Amycolatopsis ultiminotia]|uniref:NAD-dependent succinate-semialdehyde dehydrogenase n=1 Tax=Amycolatopsis ultiminotia TaxID=543629 RepID=A0ABP6YDU9_9PSEU